MTVNLVQPLSQYFDYRINQLDVRLTKIFRAQRGKLQINFDVYNILNRSYSLWTNNTYGPSWLSPTSTFDARLVKFGFQYDF